MRRGQGLGQRLRRAAHIQGHVEAAVDELGHEPERSRAGGRQNRERTPEGGYRENYPESSGSDWSGFIQSSQPSSHPNPTLRMEHCTLCPEYCNSCVPRGAHGVSFYSNSTDSWPSSTTANGASLTSQTLECAHRNLLRILPTGATGHTCRTQPGVGPLQQQASQGCDWLYPNQQGQSYSTFPAADGSYASPSAYTGNQITRPLGPGGYHRSQLQQPQNYQQHDALNRYDLRRAFTMPQGPQPPSGNPPRDYRYPHGYQPQDDPEREIYGLPLRTDTDPMHPSFTGSPDREPLPRCGFPSCMAPLNM